LSSDDTSDTSLTMTFATLGMFIIDEFSFEDEQGKPTGKVMDAQERLSVLIDSSIVVIVFCA
jgi:hypothetical protein